MLWVAELSPRTFCTFPRELVRSETATPSLANSPWIRGAPHSGFAAAIFTTRARRAAFVSGGPDGSAVTIGSSAIGAIADANGRPCRGARRTRRCATTTRRTVNNQ